jgi:glycopeptide antibiotics resistance protein
MIVHFFPYPFLISLVTVLFILIIFRVNGKPTYRLFTYFVSCVYLLLVIGLTIFPIPYNGDFLSLKPLDQIGLVFSRINWLPFQHLNWYNRKSLLFEIINNILLTIPFGILINFFVKLSWKNILWV